MRITQPMPTEQDNLPRCPRTPAAGTGARSFGQPPPSMRDFAATLDCYPSTVTFLVDRLEERGLLARRPGAGKPAGQDDHPYPARGRHEEQTLDALSGGSPLASLSLRDQRQLSDLLTRAGADPEPRLPCHF